MSVRLENPKTSRISTSRLRVEATAPTLATTTATAVRITRPFAAEARRARERSRSVVARWSSVVLGGPDGLSDHGRLDRCGPGWVQGSSTMQEGPEASPIPKKSLNKNGRRLMDSVGGSECLSYRVQERFGYTSALGCMGALGLKAFYMNLR